MCGKFEVTLWVNTVLTLVYGQTLFRRVAHVIAGSF